jgi:hypothetical protein
MRCVCNKDRAKAVLPEVVSTLNMTLAFVLAPGTPGPGGQMSPTCCKPRGAHDGPRLWYVLRLLLRPGREQGVRPALRCLLLALLLR